ncbi:MAG: hypothetical protein ACE15B_17250 [Bryobacteraceae bacterium]
MSARGKGTATGGSGSAAVAQPVKSPDQLHLFESGIRLFREGNFNEAREMFRKAGAGPDRGIAHRAELHARMCERRCAQPVQVPDTVEDHYNYAVAMINARNLELARNHLRAALQIDLSADHVYYALALCEALSGNLSMAYESLKTAIELQPRNRVAARQDVDFAPFVHQAPIDRLLGTDGK